MPDWQALFAAAAAQSPPPVAHTFVKRWPSASAPVLLVCDDGGTDREFVVKGRQGGKQPVNDQIVGRLGVGLGAPVGVPALVEVPQALIDAEPELAHMPSGLGHGSRWIPNCTERLSYEHAAEQENRARFARLAFLFGWTVAGDHQFIYENAAPRLVYSVDHGHFFPGGPDWTIASLGQAPPPTPDNAIVTTCALTPQETESGRPAATPSDELIASAIASVPADWQLPDADRVALADFLAARRDILFP